jgi:hypothetical protein
MPGSLKAILPRIAPVLGLTPDALYERQKILVQKGLLQKPVGRGRGSGQKPTVDAAAVLVAAVMVGSRSSLARLSAADIRKFADAVARAMVKGETITYRRPAPASGMQVTTTLPPDATAEILRAIP